MFDMVPFRRGRRLARREDFFDQMFESFFNDDFFPMGLRQSSFQVDIKETENEYVLIADMPGVRKEDINIEYENNYLTISTKRDEVSEVKKDDYLRRERRYGEFRRSFYADDIDIDKVHASFENGVLNMTIPKSNKKLNRKRIDIQ